MSLHFRLLFSKSLNIFLFFIIEKSHPLSYYLVIEDDVVQLHEHACTVVQGRGKVAIDVPARDRLAAAQLSPF